ncbi:MAG TPA: SDR family oxidoreductase [Niastella sp.]
MKIVVIGGTGLIGTKLVSKLRQLNYDHEVVSASPSSGVNTITGDGLARVLTNAQIVVDVSNSPYFDDQAALNFFETSGHNIFKAEKPAGIQHHIALSIVGTDRLQKSGYFQAKQTQENLVKTSGIPYTILRSTQFFEFAGAIAGSAVINDNEVHIPPAAIQPIAAAEVVEALTDIILGAPLHNTVEVAGPVAMPMDEWIRYYLNTTEDHHQLVTDAHGRYFGIELQEETLLPGEHARLGKLKYEDWSQAYYSKLASDSIRG